MALPTSTPSAQTATALDLSLVIPLFNEAESLPELVAWINKVATKENYEYEIILIDDGSTDSSWAVINTLAQQYPVVRGIKFRRNYGKSAALNEGFKFCKGNVVITLDADLQDSPDEIPALYYMITQEGYDLVSGWKQKRYDPLSKTIPTKLFNYATRKVSGIQLNDFNSGIKAYKKGVVKNIELYGDMHRYIPALAKSQGYERIGEKVVQHQARKYGVTKFGLERFINGFLDLLTLFFMSRFSIRPMHFFGVLGTLMFAIGAVIATYLSILRLFVKRYGMTDRPLFYFALLFIILGAQVFLTGFLGELIARNSPYKDQYQIEDSIRISKLTDAK